MAGAKFTEPSDRDGRETKLGFPETILLKYTGVHMGRKRWLDVDLSGLEQILSRRSKEFIVFELMQNAWDERCSIVEISIPRPNRGKSRIIVVDDAPGGFRNLSHAYTLFAHSYKKNSPAQRGMFNAGEKFVLSFCEEASIISTRGGIIFDRKGRRRTARRRKQGSEFTGIVRLSNEDWERIARAVRTAIPPVRTIFNGEEIPARTPIHKFSCVLPTVMADDLGHVKRTLRKSEVRVYQPLPGEESTLYEMGLPVVKTGDKWHIDIQQKVPLNLERDNVTPAFLQAVRVAVLNQMSGFLTAADASSTWIRHAAGDARVDEAVFNGIMDLRFGDKRVTQDPSDPEANLIAASRGYVVVSAASLSGDEWENVRRFGASLPAGRVTPSPKPFSRDGRPLKLLSPDQKLPEHVRFESFAQSLAALLIDRRLTVVFADDAAWPFTGCYGNSVLTVNTKLKNIDWFRGAASELLEKWIPFLIHELSHDSVPGHLTEGYHKECCRLAGKLARLIYQQPTSFL
jgi:hypothetical protein